jgi:hypothetical protein
MNSTLNLPNLIKDSFEGAVKMIVPSLPFLALFAFASGYLAWSAQILPDTAMGTLMFALITFAGLYAHCLFSVAMYRTMLSTSAGLYLTAWKLSLAWLLLITATAVILSIFVLFFALIPTALGTVMQAGIEPLSQETLQDVGPRELLGPVFWPTFVMFLFGLFGLFWFATRMMTFAAATSTNGTVHVFRTWPLTKGHFKVTGPAMFLLIAIPVIALSLAAIAITRAIFGTDPTALQSGISAALTMIVMAPSAWLGHSLAGNIFKQIQPTPVDAAS